MRVNDWAWKFFREQRYLMVAVSDVNLKEKFQVQSWRRLFCGFLSQQQNPVVSANFVFINRDRRHLFNGDYVTVDGVFRQQFFIRPAIDDVTLENSAPKEKEVNLFLVAAIFFSRPLNKWASIDGWWMLRFHLGSSFGGREKKASGACPTWPRFAV